MQKVQAMSKSSRFSHLLGVKDGQLRGEASPRRAAQPKTINALDEDNEDGADIADIPRRRPSKRSLSHAASKSTLASGPRQIQAFVQEEEKQGSQASNGHLAPTRQANSPSTARAKSRASSCSRSHPPSISSLSTSHSGLPALQATTGCQGLEPLESLTEELDSFDLTVPAEAPSSQGELDLEKKSELLFSASHLALIFQDPVLLQRFANFVSLSRPQSLPTLFYYLDALKALKAIDYANAIAAALPQVTGLDSSQQAPSPAESETLAEKAESAFVRMVQEDLPSFVTSTYLKTVSITIKRRVQNTLPERLKELSEGLAEVFCLTDPSRPDNQIVFASEEFYRTTQYGTTYAIGRNCRFLQGPGTNPLSVARVRDACLPGQEHAHTEALLNYRRDGSPFMNLLMTAPLYDSRGKVRYHIGAQVDVSGLVDSCAGLPSFQRLVARQTAADKDDGGTVETEGDVQGDMFRQLAETFSLQELKTVREHGGKLHHIRQDDAQSNEAVSNWNKPRLHISDDATVERRESDPELRTIENATHGGKLSGIYEHYLLVRPYPSLRILFASPTLRVPGILQSSLMSRIGGSSQLRSAMEQAFADGNGVTAKVRWISRRDPDGRGRWIHCTPLIGSNGAVGVWMVVLVDDEKEAMSRSSPDPPPVSKNIGPRYIAEPDDDVSFSDSCDLDRHGPDEPRSREAPMGQGAEVELPRSITPLGQTMSFDSVRFDSL